MIFCTVWQSVIKKQLKITLEALQLKGRKSGKHEKREASSRARSAVPAEGLLFGTPAATLASWGGGQAWGL